MCRGEQPGEKGLLGVGFVDSDFDEDNGDGNADDAYDILLYWSRFLLLWTRKPNKQTKVYFHKLSRQTPPPQVVYKP